MHLPEGVIKTPIALNRIKDLELCRSLVRMKKYNSNRNIGIIEWVDCRLYKRMFHCFSLKGATDFLSADHSLGENAHSSTENRCKHYFKCKEYKPVLAFVVSLLN